VALFFELLLPPSHEFRNLHLIILAKSFSSHSDEKPKCALAHIQPDCRELS
jgi:hypothetical protein